ncbi:MAG: hypothetical protein K8Q92_03735 [Methylophilales bacterium]|nr:hypothetical protein [Methylophilales bacterium]
MKFSIEDLRKLQIPLITLLAALVLAYLMVSMTDSRQVKASEALQTQQAALEQARQKNQSSGTEKDNIAKYLPLYEGLIKRGFIGEEQRIDWISDIRKINQQNKLFGVIYNIDAQKDYKPAFPVNTGSFKLHRSEMKLSMAMLYENDLLTLFAALPAENNPPFMLRDCTISRTNNTLRGRFEPNLDSECEIDWLTLAEPTKAKP